PRLELHAETGLRIGGVPDPAVVGKVFEDVVQALHDAPHQPVRAAPISPVPPHEIHADGLDLVRLLTPAAARPAGAGRAAGTGGGTRRAAEIRNRAQALVLLLAGLALHGRNAEVQIARGLLRL